MQTWVGAVTSRTEVSSVGDEWGIRAAAFLKAAAVQLRCLEPMPLEAELCPYLVADSPTGVEEALTPAHRRPAWGLTAVRRGSQAAGARPAEPPGVYGGGRRGRLGRVVALWCDGGRWSCHARCAPRPARAHRTAAAVAAAVAHTSSASRCELAAPGTPHSGRSGRRHQTSGRVCRHRHWFAIVLCRRRRWEARVVRRRHNGRATMGCL